MRTRNVIIVCITAILIALTVTTIATAGKPDWWRTSEKVTDEVARSAQTAVPLPLATLKGGGWLERVNLSKRLVRTSQKNKIGYLYLMSFGKFVGYYVVKGKISSVNSQMTNADQTWDSGRDTTDTVVDSIGDDGSWGPNEGGAAGVFFFTATDVFVETTLDWLYSDKPLAIANVPQLLK